MGAGWSDEDWTVRRAPNEVVRRAFGGQEDASPFEWHRTIIRLRRRWVTGKAPRGQEDCEQLRDAEEPGRCQEAKGCQIVQNAEGGQKEGTLRKAHFCHPRKAKVIKRSPDDLKGGE